ncbi:hypothetical protein BGZ80_007781 [Entomortierella chlamydospora]|uniref:Superoxide dismutase copper/zinc binding domain-containing protein n=1 Tax=Entomortierella chlamydospora TaxID=101097 RepID=A0A9P6MYH5_9FUNG|nr:hypothetical protein BGZ80_007781 [Entomortierella chlamydospora]
MSNAQQTVPQPLEAQLDMYGIKGTFLFTPLDTSSTGVKVTVNIESGLTKKFSILPTVGFEYHVHVKPVGPGGDCMETGGHLDPANIGMAKCDPTAPEKCQEGDLSGKHGNLKPTASGTIPEFSYVDNQLAFTGTDTTIAGRSVVLHNNGTRVACGNILPVHSSSSTSRTHSRSNLVLDDQNTKASLSLSNSQTNNGASADGRVSSNEVLWTIAGTLASGIVAAMLSF